MTAARNPLDTLTARKLGLPQSALCRQTIEAWQIERLNQTLDWAQTNAGFYRSRLSGCGPIGTLAEIERLPFTSATDIATDPLRFVCVSQGAIERVVTLESSGTTGAPKRLFFTAEDQQITLDFFRYGLRLMVGARDTVLVLLPGEAPGSVGDLLRRALLDIGARPVIAGFPTDLAAVAERARVEAVDLIVGIPVQVLALARHWRDQGWKERVGTVLLCSDNIPRALTRELTAIWNCAVFEDWGMTEMGYGGGVDCAAHLGYHLQEADFLFEIVDPETGRPVPDGTTGEIVLTTLTRRGMPLIRYRSGDMSRMIPGTCPCGSPLRRLDRIQSRKTGFVTLSEGALSMTALDEAMFALAGVSDYCARVDASRTRLEIGVLPSRQGWDWPELESRVRTALDNVPAVAAASRAGALRLAIDRLDRAPPLSRRKRTIEQGVAP